MSAHSTRMLIKACFPLSEFVRANKEKSNLIGWRQTLTTSPANHIRFLLVRVKEKSLIGKRSDIRNETRNVHVCNRPFSK